MARRFAVLFLLFAAPVFAQENKLNPNDNFKALNGLHAGQKVEVVETSLKKHTGTFMMVSEEAIQLREATTDVAVRRENVLRVTLLEKSHRLRNILIFGGAGCGVGAGIGAAAASSDGIVSGKPIAAAFGGVIGLLGGFGVGAAWPAHPTVYRANSH